jgi:hypothetical protein
VSVVIATSVEDPLSGVFWQAYQEAGGPPPVAVFFIAPRRRVALTRRVLEGTLLFGPLDAGRSWRRGRKVRETLRDTPRSFFPGTSAFFHVRTLNRGEGVTALEKQQPTLLVSVGAPEIFSSRVLSIPSVGAVNVHNGRLPAFRGLFGTFWEMYEGQEWGYTSLHVMEPKVDAGVVLAQGAVRMIDRSLLQILEAKKRLGAGLLAWLLGFIESQGRLPPPCPYNEMLPSRYYPWPSLGKMLQFRLRRHTTPSITGPGDPALWPPEVAVAGQADSFSR